MTIYISLCLKTLDNVSTGKKTKMKSIKYTVDLDCLENPFNSYVLKFTPYIPFKNKFINFPELF